MSQPPDHPAGPFEPAEAYEDSRKGELIRALREAPARLQETVTGLSDVELDTRYRNWTIRQIVHHLADSHVHSYIRFKWALAEDNPTIKAYEEADSVLLADSQRGDIEPPLALLEGQHAKWAQMLNFMTVEHFARTFVHPQTGETVSLWTALHYYAWHGRHHTAQIQWLRDRHAGRLPG